MPNKHFNLLLESHIDSFTNSFLSLSRELFTKKEKGLRHPSEFGRYREEICQQFLRFFIPSVYDMDTGFIINSNPDNNISTQCDIVIYDSIHTPIIQANGLPRFFPIETTIAVGEIKSVLTIPDLLESLRKLSVTKAMRCSMRPSSVIKRDRNLKEMPFNPQQRPYDNICTFLICEKIIRANKSFPEPQEIIEKINTFGIGSCLRHNMILSVEDGLLLYYDSNGKSLQYPFIANIALRERFLPPSPNNGKNCHIKYFCHYFFMAMSSINVFYPETCDYFDLPNIKDKYDYKV